MRRHTPEEGSVKEGKTMNAWRLIISGPSDGPENMSLDEALFTSLIENEVKYPTLRIYCWKLPCVTIGYFQKYYEVASGNLSITRRLTGGLSVHHGSDISYCFTASAHDWPQVYNQEKSYEHIHTGFKEGLLLMGITAEFYPAEEISAAKRCANTLCVKSIFPYDLQVKGRKIVGSSQRRRGAFLLQQGSIHIRPSEEFSSAARQLAKGMEKALSVSFVQEDISPSERAMKDVFVVNRYLTDSWNKKY
jgi:lipoate-protein ligase A